MNDKSRLTHSSRRITLRRVSLERVGLREEPLVFCPRKLSIMRVSGCSRCERFAGLCMTTGGSTDESSLRCAFSDDEPVGGEVDRDTDQLPIGVLRAPVSEIVNAPALHATADMSLEDLASTFLAEKISALPVIDDEGRPLGIVTKTDTMQRYYDHAEAATFRSVIEVLEGAPQPEVRRAPVCADDIMSRAVFSVTADTAISRVAALMAYENIHHVLVVDASGRMHGIVSALDVARWVARADGYVIPRGKCSPENA